MEIETPQRGLWGRLYHGETSFDFVGHRRRWFLLSAIVIGVGLASLGIRGLNFGIDFRGGTAWEVIAPSLSVSDARDAMGNVGHRDAQIQRIGGDTIRVRTEITGTPDERQDEQNKVAAELAKVARVSRNDVSINDVGPSWGNQISEKARQALVVFFIVIFVYITARLEWKMAVAALAAVVHDIGVTVGVYSLSGFEVAPATVIAFLTILGYSLYDTIVVFDKVQENTRGLAASGRMTYADTVNLSMNQVLMRSLNTSLVAILPILSVLVVGAYVLGAATLEQFGLALLVGLLTGAYSSIYIAAPVLAILKEREPRYAQIRQRLATRGGAGPLTPAAAATMGMPSAGGDGSVSTPVSGPSAVPRPGGPPRPPRGRKRGKRR